MSRSIGRLLYELAGAATGVPHEAQNLAPSASSSPQLAQFCVGGVMAVPQDEQNLAPAAFSALQLGQLDVGGASDVPHDAQNFAPGMLAVLHDGHATVAGAPPPCGENPWPPPAKPGALGGTGPCCCGG